VEGSTALLGLPYASLCSSSAVRGRPGGSDAVTDFVGINDPRQEVSERRPLALR
jgi:hypothetical protein